jgi:energy-coupling factor transport system ATP-binding protein
VIDPIVSIENLTHVFGTGSTPVVAVDQVTLEVARGSCIAIVGAGGSGKSTLVKHLNGLLRPTSGRVVVDGIEIRAGRFNLIGLRRRVGMLFQSPEAQLFERTVYAEVAFGLRQLGLARREMNPRITSALDRVGLPARTFGSRSPFELSGGQMRRVALASVLALEPSLLVLDEPTVGLDAAGREEFYACVACARRERGMTVILVSHDMDEVADVADRVAVMDHGRLVALGAPREVFGRVDDLASWRLAPPPLAELVGRLRARGAAIPPDALTLDEVITALEPLAPRMR